MESVLGRLSLFRAGEMGTRIQESHLSCQHYAPTLNSGEAHSAALVARFAAGRTLAVRRRGAASPTSRRPALSSASESIAASCNRAEREALAERYYPFAFCEKEQGYGDGCRLWHLNVVVLTYSRDSDQ